MASYLHPGVYVEEIPSGSKPIEAAGTSTACFIGYAVQGPLSTSAAVEPTFISKWDHYDDQFGGLQNLKTTNGDQLGHAVRAFFMNGGGKAYVVRLAKNAKAATGSVLHPDADAEENAVNKAINFKAANEGAWGNDLVVSLEAKDGAYSVTIGRKYKEGSKDKVQNLESFDGVSLTETDAKSIDNVLGDSSSLVSCTFENATNAVRTAITNSGNTLKAVDFVSGSDGVLPDVGDYKSVFTALEKFRDVNMICLPGQYVGVTSGGSSNTAVSDAISHCEKMGNRMVIVDPEPGKELKPGTISTSNTPTSTYSALYYPWLKVANPYYDAETNPGADRNLTIAPCGFIAGMWAKIDARRGVWKAPAGIETKLLGASGLEYQVEDPEQDALNPIGFNCLRTQPNFGRVIWGARTCATKVNPEWRYVPVRRTAMLVEESVYSGIQWAVFEPNDHRLWSGLRSNIDSFMNGLFRAGAFQGEKSSDAYFVRCGLGDTMTQGDIDRGQVIVIVGFAPVKPAEFVIVRIQQKVGQE